ncbi:MAG: S8/S53 family peptidase [Planctomycetaceae bacterium]
MSAERTVPSRDAPEGPVTGFLSRRQWLLTMGLTGFLPSFLLAGEPVEPTSFVHAGIVEAWRAYADRLSFGRGQTLALVDDGCKLDMPEWSTPVDGIPKVRVSYDSVSDDDDPRHEGRGYHGSTIGIPSSLNHQGRWGVAYQNQVAVIRALECCHCHVSDSVSLAKGLEWIVRHHKRYAITTVNLAPVDDLAHSEPVPTGIDAPLKRLRELGLWVSAPTGNHDFRDGISWPACQPHCFAIGAVKPVSPAPAPEAEVIYLDRHRKVDLVVPAAATSSSNALACGAAMLLREAISLRKFDWKPVGATLPEAILAIFQKTGHAAHDPGSNLTFRRLNVKRALDFVWG